MTIDALRSLRRQVIPIALDIYDRLFPTSLLPALAQVVDNSQLQLTPYEVEWWNAFATLRRWIDEKSLQRIFTNNLSVSPEDWEITMAYDRTKVNESGVLVNPQEVAQTFAVGVLRGRLRNVLDVYRTNPVAYDGNALYDADHAHFDDTPYSNVLPAGVDVAARADASAPTYQEAEAEMVAAKARLFLNVAFLEEAAEAAQIDQNLIAIVRSDGVYSAFKGLLELERLEAGGPANRLKGTFRLVRDMKPGSADPNSWDLVHAEPGGLRPAVQVLWKAFPNVEFEEPKFAKKLTPFGVEDKAGNKAAFPQVTVRTYN
ncbi:MAG TPA: Mu-like prophage major head subunit gpT family protein [Thermoanaerobaculia bacterium]|nr:Mu-like prophage major head subunit gpT family protein [Thermoanaerobaculia bacterium]